MLRWVALALAAGPLAWCWCAGCAARRWGCAAPRRGRAARRAAGPRIYKLYETVLARLAKRGWTRRRAETPREFAARLRAAQRARAPRRWPS